MPIPRWAPSAAAARLLVLASAATESAHAVAVRRRRVGILRKLCVAVVHGASGANGCVDSSGTGWDGTKEVLLELEDEQEQVEECLGIEGSCNVGQSVGAQGGRRVHYDYYHWLFLNIV